MSDSPASWCVYESATGIKWMTTPPTEERAHAEAALSGIGHEAMPLELARMLSNAFAHGRTRGHQQAREQSAE